MNHFQGRLQLQDYDALMREAMIVPLKFRERMINQDERIDAVYFPITCMFSLLVTNDGQPQMEMATIGNEGMVGASEALQMQGAIGLNLVQLPGTAVRIDADDFRKVINSRMPMQSLIHQHVYALLRQILYVAACNRSHSMEERCARWLLMTHYRAGQPDTLP